MKLSVEKQRGTGYSLVSPHGRLVAVGIASELDAKLLAAGFYLMTSGAKKVTAHMPGVVHTINLEGVIK